MDGPGRALAGFEAPGACGRWIAGPEEGGGPGGELVGDGQCVTFIHAVIATPPAPLWRQGSTVRGDGTLQPGTVIATFGAVGRYGYHLDGRSYAAVHVGQNAVVLVLDQWNGHTTQRVHERIIRFKAGHGTMVDDGDQVYVAE